VRDALTAQARLLQRNQAMDTAINLSDRAADKVRTLMDAEGNPGLKLRVFITGGGCSGFSYGFTFDEDVAEDDAVVERDGVTMVVDALSYPYLSGSQVDYQEGLQGAQFVVANPNATATCGCGNSFAI
jgi:iron-sulfur cluster insertion protein